MRNSFYVGLLFILLGLIALMIKFNLDVEGVHNELVCEVAIKDKQIEELQKEIRVLKTDINIIQYRYESEEGKQNEASKM